METNYNMKRVTKQELRQMAGIAAGIVCAAFCIFGIAFPAFVAGSVCAGVIFYHN